MMRGASIRWIDNRHRLLLAAGVVAAAALPFLLPGYILYLFTLAIIFAVAILGLNLLTGFTGQFSLGHSAFFAIGGYTLASLGEHAGVSVYGAIPLAGVAGFAAGYVFGWPAVRFSFIHLAMITFGLAVATPQILKFDLIAPVTGGVQGLYIERPPPLLGLTNDQWWYFVSLAIFAALIWLLGNLVSGRTGRALIAIRDHEVAAAGMGINVARYKTLVFGISAAVAAVAGALHAVISDFIAPDRFTFSLSVLLLVGAVIGGIRSIFGAAFGGLFIQFWPDISLEVSAGLLFPAHGLVLVVAVLVMPEGAAGLVRKIDDMLFARKPFGGPGRPPSMR